MRKIRDRKKIDNDEGMKLIRKTVFNQEDDT